MSVLDQLFTVYRCPRCSNVFTDIDEAQTCLVAHLRQDVMNVAGTLGDSVWAYLLQDQGGVTTITDNLTALIDAAIETFEQ